MCPILVLTDKDKEVLLQILEMHRDGLDVAKDRIIEVEGGGDLLPMTAAVDEAVEVVNKIVRRLKDAI